MKSTIKYLLIGGGALAAYALFAPKGIQAGSQVNVPAGTAVYSDAQLQTSAGTTSFAGPATVLSVSGSAANIQFGTNNYWVQTSALQA
jgi:hypothetical protein